MIIKTIISWFPKTQLSIAPAIIAGGAILGGAVLEGAFGRSSAKKSISFQREIAQKAHQYEVADLRAAGLNPILSGLGGKGASASGGAMPATPNFSAAALNATLTAQRTNAEIKNIKALTALTDAKTDVISPTAGIGEDISDAYNWIKNRFPTSAKDVKRLYNDYKQFIKEQLKGKTKKTDPVDMVIEGKYRKRKKERKNK